jgi:hypothetical protein
VARGRQRRRPYALLVSLGLVVITACGTTVSEPDRAAVNNGSAGGDSGLSVAPAIGAPTYQAGTPGTTGTTSADTHSAAPTLSSEAATKPATKAPAFVPPTTTTSPGTESGPIKIGYAYLDSGQSNSVLSGIGKGLATADVHAEMDAYVRSINANGGVLGRPLKMVYYRGSTSSNLLAMGAAVCAKETQDERVDVSLDSNYGDVVFPCMAKAGIPTVYTGLDGLTSSDYRRFPLVIEPNSISLDRLARIQVEQFVKMGYKPTGTTEKLGVLYYNSPSFTAGYNALKVAWAAQGVTVTDARSFTNFNTVGEIAALGASVQGTELRFRAEGINHVMCVETNAFLCGFFGLYADSQGYYPRYAYTSDQPLTNILANISARGLTNSVFVGWNPSQDMNSPSKMPTSTQRCLNFMTQHRFPTDTGNERDSASAICEAIDYVVAAIEAGGSATADGIIAGARKIAGSYQSRRTFDVGQPPDAVSTVRRGQYSATCHCFLYTSKPIKAP